jgi:hypothetical protein
VPGPEQFCVGTVYELCSNSASPCGTDHVCLSSVSRQSCPVYGGVLLRGCRGTVRVTAHLCLGSGL